METVEPVTWNLAKGNLLYLTDKEEQMTALVKHIAKGKQKVIVLAPKYHNLPEMEGVLLVSGGEALDLMIDGIKEKIHVRLDERNTKHEATVIVYNMTELTEELSQSSLESLEFILDKGT